MIDDNENFISIATAIGETSRAKMLWLLLDGKAYTARELATEAEISESATSNHLVKLLNSNILKVEKQGRHRYYTFYSQDIAYAIEALAGVVPQRKELSRKQSGIEYCRTCYDHLAGEIGVKITDVFLKKDLLLVQGRDLVLTEKGYLWFAQLGIDRGMMANKKRLFARFCLDWTERRFHLSGYLPSLFLTKMLELGWFKKIAFTRELFITLEGKKQLQKILGLTF